MKRHFWSKLFYLVTCCVLVFANIGSVVAADTSNTPDSPTQPTELDDGVLEVGVYYVNDYENCAPWGLGDLGRTDDDALSLRDRLTAANYFLWFTYPTPRWSAPIVWGNGNAWEEDWKRNTASGTEDNWIDTVDLAYFSGHGSETGFFFGVGGNKHDDCILTAEDAQAAWGTRDNDWIGLSACNVLNDPYDPNLRRWARTMNGTRLLMGFKTVMDDVNFGNELGWHIRWGKTMPQAWFLSVNTLLPGSQIARILAEAPAYFNDRWYNHNSPTVVDSNFSWWTHQAGTSVASTVSAASSARVSRLLALGGEMPVFKVAPLALADAERKYAGISQAFGLTDTTPISGVVAADIFGPLADDTKIFVSDDGDLLMDANAGNYIYIDSAQLWNGDAVFAAAIQAAANQRVQIDEKEAQRIADAFLAQHQLLDPGAVRGGVQTDTIEGGSYVTPTVSSASLSAIEQMLQEQPITTNYVVNYARVISYTPPVVGAAVAEPMVFDVVGPGPKLAVYVAPTVSADVSAAALVNEAVIGGQGGWRTIQQLFAADSSQVTVSMLPTSTVQTLYAQVGERVTLGYVPLPAVSKEIIAFDAGLCEGPIGMEMNALINVYIATVKATLADNTTQQYTQNIPVNPSFMAPYAQIIAPAGAESSVPGATVKLRAADASKKLNELGYDAALDFALGTGNPSSYTYDWYMNEISTTTTLTPVVGSGGQQVQFTVPTAVGAGKPATVKIILVVTDSLKQGEPKIAKDEFTLNFSNMFLPVIDK